MILILAAAVASPSPSPSPIPAAADVCGSPHTNLLAALDRPSIGYSACSAKPGEFIPEAGWANTSGSSAFLRYGAARNFEVDGIVGGAGDSGLGMKYEWWHDGSRALATDFLYTMPTGTADFTAGAPIETLNVDYTTPLSSVFSLAGTLGTQSSYAAALSGASGRFISFLPSLVLADQWNPRAQAFVEAFGQTRTRPDGGAQLGLDAAFQYMLTPQIEIDVETGRTINDVNRSHYAGFGFGMRF